MKLSSLAVAISLSTASPAVQAATNATSSPNPFITRPPTLPPIGCGPNRTWYFDNVTPDLNGERGTCVSILPVPDGIEPTITVGEIVVPNEFDTAEECCAVVDDAGFISEAECLETAVDNCPSLAPSVSAIPSTVPTSSPSGVPSESPSLSQVPSSVPSAKPSPQPSSEPSDVPSEMPSSEPSSKPSSSSMPTGSPAPTICDVSSKSGKSTGGSKSGKSEGGGDGKSGKSTDGSKSGKSNGSGSKWGKSSANNSPTLLAICDETSKSSKSAVATSSPTAPITPSPTARPTTASPTRANAKSGKSQGVVAKSAKSGNTVGAKSAKSDSTSTGKSGKTGSPTNRPTSGIVIASDDRYEVNPTVTLSRPLLVLDNDSSNPPGRALRVDAIIDDANDGQCLISADALSIRYVPPSVGISSSVFCTYRACTDDEGSEACDVAEVEIRFVTGPPGPTPGTPNPTPNSGTRPTSNPTSNPTATSKSGKSTSTTETSSKSAKSATTTTEPSSKSAKSTHGSRDDGMQTVRSIEGNTEENEENFDGNMSVRN